MTRVLFLLLAVAALSACNTINGFGQDMRATGQAISNVAK
jgi:predicted small secreted protein